MLRSVIFRECRLRGERLVDFNETDSTHIAKTMYRHTKPTYFLVLLKDNHLVALSVALDGSCNSAVTTSNDDDSDP